MSSTPGLGGRDLAAERAAARERLRPQKLIPPAGLPTARLSELMPSPENGRKKLHKVEELAAALKTDGMNTAMTVVPPEVFVARYPQHKAAVEKAVANGVRFVVHHGHRRLAAASSAGLHEVPILIRHEVPSLRIAAIQENLQRMSLNPIEEGEEFQKALDEEVDETTGKPYTQRSLAARVGASQTYISHRVALLRLVPPLQEAVVNHWLKEQDVPMDADRIVLPVRQAATIYARLIPELQKSLIREPAEAAIVCKLREELQAVFHDGELTLDRATEIGKLPPAQQTLLRPNPDPTVPPAPPVTRNDEPPTPPAPPGVPSNNGQTPLPTPRGGEADSVGGPIPKPEPSGVPADEVVADYTNTGEPTEEEQKTAVLTAEPRVIEIRGRDDLDQLVLTLIDTLTDEERSYVREHLV